MAMPETREAEVFDVEARDEWLRKLDGLIANVEGWAEADGWACRRIEKDIRDSKLGPYRAPVLLMQRDTVRAILDPVARFAPGTEGVVDLCLMPTYDDIASLYFLEGGWKLQHVSRGAAGRAKSRGARSMDLDPESFKRVLESMAIHAA